MKYWSFYCVVCGDWIEDSWDKTAWYHDGTQWFHDCLKANEPFAYGLYGMIMSGKTSRYNLSRFERRWDGNERDRFQEQVESLISIYREIKYLYESPR